MTFKVAVKNLDICIKTILMGETIEITEKSTCYNSIVDVQSYDHPQSAPTIYNFEGPCT